MKLPLFAQTPTTANTNVTWLFEHRAFRPFAGITGEGHQERAEEIVRACNAHEELQRMAELVLSAAKYRRDQEWKLMHLDLSEAAEIALRHTAGVQP